MMRENEVKGIIYSAKNIDTGEYYVGATTSTIEQRRKDHEEKADNGYGGYFQSSIAGYGNDAFEWVQEDTASSLNELAKKERDYIIKYDSKSKGYNKNLGGGFKKDIYMYNICGSYLRTFDSLQEAANWAGTTKKEISRTCLSKHKIKSGFMWSYEFVETLYTERDDRCKIVYQFTLDGDLITEFDSVSEASCLTGTNKSSIAKVCRGERNQAGGFKWKYRDIVKEFSILKNNLFSGSNYISMWDGGEFMEIIMYKDKRSKKVIQTSQFTSSSEIYRSISEASRITGINRNSISRACRGLQKTAGGFKWAFDTSNGVIIH